MCKMLVTLIFIVDVLQTPENVHEMNKMRTLFSKATLINCLQA